MFLAEALAKRAEADKAAKRLKSWHMAPIGGSAGAFNSLVLQGTHPVRLTIGTTAHKTAEQVIDYYRRAGNQPLNEGWERGHIL